MMIRKKDWEVECREVVFMKEEGRGMKCEREEWCNMSS